MGFLLTQRCFQFAETIDPNAYAVASLQERAGLHIDTCRRTRENYVAGVQRKTFTQVCDLFGDGVQMVRFARNFAFQ
jgi:hypothetical protein